ncbi:MAG: hypothetical protein KC457_17015 [Myxococcales bacterium]|nr:hypothetical protein [Myxococcales bacterium]
MRPSPSLVLALATGACVSATDPDTAVTLGDEAELDSSDADEDTVTGDDAPVLDQGADPSPALRCEKVDLLFVIDDSHSMASEQGNLIASFPEFFANIQATLDTVDSVQVGVVATDAYAFNAEACRSLGALVTQTGGAGSSNAVCGPFSGASGTFMTEADALDAFSCAGQLGIDGSIDERPMEAMLTALDSSLSEAGGCNEGFSRKDALLVVVVITDEEDDHQEISGQLHGSPGEPEDWFAALAAHKGVESNVAVLSIIGGLPDNECGEPVGVGAEPSPRLQAFTQMFSHGFLGDICAWSYGPFFSEAIEVVESACADFEAVP